MDESIKKTYEQMLDEAKKPGSGCSESYINYLKDVLAEKSPIFDCHKADAFKMKEIDFKKVLDNYDVLGAFMPLEPKRYYFIAYQWQKKNDPHSAWKVENAVTHEKPMEWLKSGLEDEDYYRILFYSEITEAEYKSLKGEL